MLIRKRLIARLFFQLAFIEAARLSPQGLLSLHTLMIRHTEILYFHLYFYYNTENITHFFFSSSIFSFILATTSTPELRYIEIFRSFIYASFFSYLPPPRYADAICYMIIYIIYIFDDYIFLRALSSDESIFIFLTEKIFIYMCREATLVIDYYIDIICHILHLFHLHYHIYIYLIIYILH